MQSTSTTDRHQLAMEGRSGLLSKSSSHWHQHQRRQQQRHLHLQQRPSSVSRRLMSASAGKFHGTSDTPAEVPSCTTPARATAATAACRGSVSSATRVYQGIVIMFMSQPKISPWWIDVLCVWVRAVLVW
eukprot:GHVQ01021214.1.p1 GENE.GHVQ01021214.1~~GHVQ01021214.1.p1  ORF type:complete len:130 (-),score=17.43 GHVQ01021214.1:66-455(-)